MPVLEYRLAEGRYTDDQIAELLLESSRFYAQVLNSPVERVRVLAQLHKPQHAVMGGKLLSEGGAAAPVFHFLVLEGRPLDECQQLMAGLSEITARTLGVDLQLVRGGCWPIPPQYWAIGGVPASQARQGEIQARAVAAASASAPDNLQPSPAPAP